MPEHTEITLPKDDVDPFDAAFKEFSMPEGTAPAAPVDETPEPPPVVEDEAPPAVEDETPPAVETPEPKPAEPPPATPPGETDEALLARLAALVGKAQPAEQPAAPVAPEAPPVFTQEEAEFLAEYEKEWGDVAKAEALKRRAENDALVRYVFNEVAGVFRPMEQNLQRLLQQAQLAELRGAVPEYDNVRDNVVAWAEKQPPYLRAAYQHVIQQGTAEEIADLVSRYNKETGTVPAPVPQQKSVTELPMSAKQAAATLAPVSSKRSAVAAVEPDKGDFDSAFERFASAP
jgi:hypothetical protein